jgi:hypothetical protein
MTQQSQLQQSGLPYPEKTSKKSHKQWFLLLSVLHCPMIFIAQAMVSIAQCSSLPKQCFKLPTIDQRLETKD